MVKRNPNVNSVCHKERLKLCDPDWIFLINRKMKKITALSLTMLVVTVMSIVTSCSKEVTLEDCI